MTDSFAIIAAASEREAMDWSLVLASQGIEAAIEHPPESAAWLLVVPVAEFERAQGAIRQYLAENRHGFWRRELPWSGLIYDWRNVAWLIVLAAMFWLMRTRAPYLHDAGVMHVEAVRSGEWWRLFTATMLHADVGHLAANLTSGMVLLGLAMGSFGAGWGLLAAFLAGAGGNLAGLCFYPEAHRSLGASGMIMGALGLLTAQSVALWRAGLGARQLAARGVAGGVLLLILLGLSPEARTDVVAHVGGFVGGLILGVVLGAMPPRLLHSAVAQRTADALLLGLAVLTWWLALR